MKIPFDIKFKPQIESGEYKVVTAEGRPVRIICWDKKSEKKYGYHIVGLIEFGPNHEESAYYTIDGCCLLEDKEPCLFIVTPEPKPELSEFEKAVGLEIFDEPFEEKHIKVIKEESKKLLSLARKEIEEELKEKVLHDYWRQASDQCAQARKEAKAEALNDLPRWRKVKGARGYNYSQETKFSINGRYLEMNDTLNNIYEISFEELEKLSRL